MSVGDKTIPLTRRQVSLVASGLKNKAIPLMTGQVLEVMWLAIWGFKTTTSAHVRGPIVWEAMKTCGK